MIVEMESIQSNKT
jgi:hypothetical protein